MMNNIHEIAIIVHFLTTIITNFKRVRSWFAVFRYSPQSKYHHVVNSVQPPAGNNSFTLFSLLSLTKTPFIVPQRSAKTESSHFSLEKRFPFLRLMADSTESPSTSASEPNSIPNPNPNSLIHPRREPFEHGLLPIPKLIFPDPIQTLTQLRQKLISHPRVDYATLADTLQISADHAKLVLDTLASVLHNEADPLVKAQPGEIDSVGADLHDLILFLYIQSYKKLLPRTHKDSAAVADVWPSTSAFDGYLSALSPLQVLFLVFFFYFIWYLVKMSPFWPLILWLGVLIDIFLFGLSNWIGVCSSWACFWFGMR